MRPIKKTRFEVPRWVYCGVILLVAVLVSHRPAGAATLFGDSLGLSPFWTWKEVVTPHFRVTFPKELESQAQKAAQYLEEAHELLSPRLYWNPRSRTQVLLIDNTDMANGLTSAVLRLGIVLYAVPPDNGSTVRFYDHWLRLLVIHEYVHFLNTDPARGIFGVLRYVFGDLFLPNAMWPSWMLEGLAVYFETRLTRSGRGTGSQWEMILRTAVDEGVLNRSSFVTLDKVNGENPYPPGGETAYLFGYHLWNQIVQDPDNRDRDQTADGYGLDGAEDILGTVSMRSSQRVPFFINGNLENIAGKDWYQVWDEWVSGTRTRMRAQISKIRSQPVSSIEYIEPEGGYSILSSELSPDKRWLAFTQETLKDRTALYLMDLRTKEVKHVLDKFAGGSMAFTPDSKQLVFSRIQRNAQYYLYNDLALYDLETDSVTSLSDGKRARDPDVASDGRVAYIVTENAQASLAIARLKREDGGVRLEGETVVYKAPPYDQLENPRFSPDGRGLVVGIHRDGKNAEGLYRFDLTSRTMTALVDQGAYNRFPFYGQDKALYYVSDASGVDNVYRMDSRGVVDQQTNVVSGVAFPSLLDERHFIGAVYTSKGWRVSKIQRTSVATDRVRLDPAPDPGDPEPDLEGKSRDTYEVRDYSIFPSILPRQWAPFLQLSDNEFYFGGIVSGFDATHRHEYALLAAYSDLVRNPDFLLHYGNRSFGPQLDVNVSFLTSDWLSSGRNLIVYDKRLRASASLSFPFKWTYSTLTPVIGGQVDRKLRYEPGFRNHKVGVDIPSVDAQIFFDNREESRLAVTTEGGRSAKIGARAYFTSQEVNWKSVVSDTEHLRVLDHSVIVPTLGASAVPHSSGHVDSNVIVRGGSPRIFESGASAPNLNLDEVSIRGYPQRTFLTRSVLVGSLEYRFPIFSVFRGWGTNPFFAKQLSAFGFADAVRFSKIQLPAVGGGIRLSTELLLRVPLILSLEYHRGLKRTLGGQGELFFTCFVNGLSF